MRHALTRLNAEGNDAKSSNSSNSSNRSNGGSSKGTSDTSRGDVMDYGVIRQVLADDWTVAKDFLTSLTHKDKGLLRTDYDPVPGPDASIDPPFQCVIKPCRGSASLGEFLVFRFLYNLTSPATIDL